MKILKNTLLMLCSAAMISSCSTVKKVNAESEKLVVTPQVADMDYPLADTIYKYSVDEVFTGYDLSKDMLFVASEMEKNIGDFATVKQLGQGIVVSFANDGAMFPFGKYKLTEDAKAKLRRLAFNLTENPNTFVAAFGRTDAIGPADFNEDLGYMRASMVANYLSECGVDKDRLFVDSFGEKYPKMLGDDNATMFEKRRVDILIIPSNDMRDFTSI